MRIILKHNRAIHKNMGLPITLRVFKCNGYSVFHQSIGSGSDCDQELMGNVSGTFDGSLLSFNFAQTFKIKSVGLGLDLLCNKEIKRDLVISLNAFE